MYEASSDRSGKIPTREEIISEIEHYERLSARLLTPANPHERAQRMVFETLAAYGRALLHQLEQQAEETSAPQADEHEQP